MEEVIRNPLKPIVIVEGEKSALAAQKIFGENFICISWLGGSRAASKVDWSLLFNRDVTIWPDNDVAGFKAANDICAALRKVGVSTLKVVSTEELKKALPEKWDLADSLPANLNNDFIQEKILNAQPKAIGLQRLEAYLDRDQTSLSELIKLNEVLWRVDARMRGPLEKEHGNKFWEIEREILKGFEQILKSKIDIEKFSRSNGIPKDESLVYQAVLYHAKYGKMPQLDELNQIKVAIAECHKLIKSDSVGSVEFNRTITNSIEIKQNSYLVPQTNNFSLTKDIKAVTTQYSLDD